MARGAKAGRKAQNEPSATSSIKVGLDVRESGPSLLPFFQQFDDLHHCEDVMSLFPQVIPTKLRGKSVNLDVPLTLTRWTSEGKTPFHGKLTYRQGLVEHTVPAYQKRIPLLDPYRWMKYKERPNKPFFWQFQGNGVLEPQNQAYVDCMSSYLVDKLGKLVNSPHFCTFYGGFRAVAKTFRYNLEDDLEDVRFTRWFWEALEANEFSLAVTETSTGRRLTLQECKELMKPDEEFLHDDSDSDSDESDESEESDCSGVSAEELPQEGLPTPYAAVDLEEAFLPDDVSSAPIQLKPRASSATSTPSTTDTESSFLDEYSVVAEFTDMPIVVMFARACEGTMDELLESKEYAPINSELRAQKWSAWLLQVIFALIQLQGTLRLTHNDLHTNNVLWVPTDKEFLWYKDSSGRVWKVPTYGKLFTIIDYGRAVLNMNSFWIISSDYEDGHDACGQYNFGPIEDPDEPKVLPNNSFDLCRLSCSMIRGLYPINPPGQLDGTVLSQEGAWRVNTTDQPLFNLLWSWLVDDDGHTILENRSGEEKYPGFDLYIMIAQKVHKAVPKEQLKLPIFQQFMSKETVPTGSVASYVPL